MHNNITKTSFESFRMAGLFTLALRLVVGWTYFSAFWRRLFLANKLDPESAGYIGQKFNHFLPNALGIQPMIEYMVTHPDTLWWAMVSFTIIEGIVGLLFMLGAFTRFMSVGVFGLAMGILLGAGWLGTTCLDEWQIGVLGVAAGFTIFFSGSGTYSLDYWLLKNKASWRDSKAFSLLGSGVLPLSYRNLSKIIGLGAIAIFGLTLFTNQYFHGGVWGELHNKSVKPKIEIADAQLTDQVLQFEIYRTEGVDVYGSFLIGMSLTADTKAGVWELNPEELASLPKDFIDNKYLVQVKPGPHSLEIPLGAKAMLSINDPEFENLPPGTYSLILTDISGAEWSIPLQKE